MTAAEFLAEIPARTDSRRFSESEIEADLERWAMLVDLLDFHAKKWYEHDDKGQWVEVSFFRVTEILRSVGVHELEIEPLIKLFSVRDQESHARPTDDVRQAQLRFGI